MLFDANVLDHGKTGVTDTNLTAQLVGSWLDVSGIGRHGLYGVVVPSLQTDGVTATTGTLTVTLDFSDDKSTILATTSEVGVGSGVARPLRFSVGAQYMRATLTPTLNSGNVIAGLAAGGRFHTGIAGLSG